MFETMPFYLGILILIALAIDITVHWPSSRKLLEYENKNLKKESEQNNKLINDLQKNIKSMADARDKDKEDIEQLQQIITILAKAQGIDDWRAELLKK